MSVIYMNIEYEPVQQLEPQQHASVQGPLYTLVHKYEHVTLRNVIITVIMLITEKG